MRRETDRLTEWFHGLHFTAKNKERERKWESETNEKFKERGIGRCLHSLMCVELCADVCYCVLCVWVGGWPYSLCVSVFV